MKGVPFFFFIKGITKVVAFLSKWYTTGQGVGPQGRAFVEYPLPLPRGMSAMTFCMLPKSRPDSFLEKIDIITILYPC